jgi:hypothetical protein
MDETWVIPERVATEMDNFRTFRYEGPAMELATDLMRWWKQWILINPLRVLKYNVNNLSGDMDISLAYDPPIVTQESYQAAKDLWADWHGKPLSDMVKAEFDYLKRKGNIGAGMTVHDIPDITRNLEMKNFVAMMKGEKLNLIQRWWQTSKSFTTWRENILRVAAYRRILKRLNAGEKHVYGVSIPEQVDKEETNEDKAALISRELIGDYGNISQAGQTIRRKLIPFYSWMEINAPRYVKLFRNLPLEGKGRKNAITFGSLAFGKQAAILAFKAGLLYAMINMWNLIFFPDEEEEMGMTGRRQLHIILGRWPDGTIISLRFQGALSDALEWFGGEDFPADIKDLATRKTSFYDLFKEAALAPVQKIARGIRPDIKLPFELVSGKSTYPDIFRQKPIRDIGQHILQTVSLDIPYTWATGKPKQGGNFMERFLYDFSNLLVYSTDPGQTAYYETRELADKFLRKQGYERPMVEPTNKSNALYYYKQALRYGDLKAAQKYIKQYEKLGGTFKGLQISIKLSHPMAGIPIRFRGGFMKSLSAQDQSKLKSAIRWYEQIYLKKSRIGKEAANE